MEATDDDSGHTLKVEPKINAEGIVEYVSVLDGQGTFKSTHESVQWIYMRFLREEVVLKGLKYNVQKCLNRSVSNRTITKQEAVCQLGKLPLVICSETIDTVSLSGVVRVTNGTNSTYKTFLSKYNTRTTHLDKSLHHFFHLTKNHRTI